jgi:hypothetical protein
MSKSRTGGPQTDAGKAKCAQNAVKHGATSTKMFVLANESREAWEQLLAATASDYKPTTEIEHQYVVAIAFAIWRLRRIWAVQTCAINLKMDDQAAYYAATYVHEDATVRHTLAIEALTREEEELARLTRYETALQRAHDRAVRNLMNLRQLRADESTNCELTKQTPPLPGTPPTHAERQRQPPSADTPVCECASQPAAQITRFEPRSPTLVQKPSVQHLIVLPDGEPEART